MSTNISARIAARINPVREAVIDPSFRFVTKLEALPTQQVVLMVAIPSAILFGSLCLIPGDSNSVFGWRVLAHVGPYRVPALVEAKLWRSSLESLSQRLTSSEISQHLTNIEVVTQRRFAVRQIVDQFGFATFVPVFRLLAESDSQSNFEATLRIAMDVVAATRAENREVPWEIIESLFDSAWCTSDLRFSEYRLLLILRLLQNEKNLENAKKSIKFAIFLSQQDSTHKPFPTLPLMPLLYQFKTEKLGYETFDIVRKIRTMMGTVDENSERRKSMSLSNKLDFVYFENLVYLTLCYGSIRILPMISEYTFPVLKSAGLTLTKSILGVSFLELWYRAEEHFIQSNAYAASAHPLVASAMMVSAHTGILVLALKRFPFCFAPFLATKLVRDAFTDGYRFT